MKTLLVLATVMCTVNLVLCAAIVRSDYFTPLQKFLQCLIVWVVPVVEPVVIYSFLRSQGISQASKPDDRPEREEHVVDFPRDSHHDSFGNGDLS